MRERRESMLDWSQISIQVFLLVNLRDVNPSLANSWDVNSRLALLYGKAHPITARYGNLSYSRAYLRHRKTDLKLTSYPAPTKAISCSLEPLGVITTGTLGSAMCGRYALSKSPDEIIEEFEITTGYAGPVLPADWNITPTRNIYIINAVSHSTRKADQYENTFPANSRELSIASWGLIAPWSKDLSLIHI